MNSWETKNGWQARAIVGEYWRTDGDAGCRDAAIRWLLKSGIVTLDPPTDAVRIFTVQWEYKREGMDTIYGSGRTLDHALIRLVLAVSFDCVEKEHK